MCNYWGERRRRRSSSRAGAGPTLASAGPDWRHFFGAPLSCVFRNFWGVKSSHNDRNQWCEYARFKKGTALLWMSGDMPSNFNSPEESLMDNSMSYYPQYLQRGGTIGCSASAHPELKTLAVIGKDYNSPCRVYWPWTTYNTSLFGGSTLLK